MLETFRTGRTTRIMTEWFNFKRNSQTISERDSKSKYWIEIRFDEMKTFLSWVGAVQKGYNLHWVSKYELWAGQSALQLHWN